uniref:Uncharacterized protein n=1 Tax=Geoglobus ahangari TaxID=113653 RepID=A0A7C4S5L3_9EURY
MTKSLREFEFLKKADFNGLDLFDLDVEEPNAYHFTKGGRTERNAYRKVPQIDEKKCTVFRDNCCGQSPPIPRIVS